MGVTVSVSVCKSIYVSLSVCVCVWQVSPHRPWVEVRARPVVVVVWSQGQDSLRDNRK